MPKLSLSALPALLLPLAAQAHEGHGAAALHLHPAQWAGLAALAVVVVAGIVHFRKP